jgi:NADH-quinone oxidoreductase subunit L
MVEYAWLIPIFPLLSFATIILFINRWKRASSALTIGTMAVSMLLSLGILFTVIGTEHFETFQMSFPWLPTGETWLDLGFMVDPLTAMMLFVVTAVGLNIFVYSQGYMHADPRYSRFFAYLSLFGMAMLGLVIANNLLLLFIFWELVGLCSYLLIGFWFEKTSAANAAKKAFITTRIGDIGFYLGLILIYINTGSIQYTEIFARIEGLAEGNPGLVTVMGLLVFCGAVGKSAQFPLHVWLPDAMEGPTPVSALIHAATMVAAGVYLVARMFPLFEAVHPSQSMLVVAYIGAFTAIFASTIAVAQNDIKRVLAYSTISQLGYMIMGLGVGGFVAGVFHLMTHAFFKALLFLGSGSVIHGVHEEQDMMNMGGLRKRMPITFWTFLFGTLALAGIFPFAGFWSKDEILLDAFNENMIVYVLGAVAAFLTAFYMARQVFLTFFGEPRSEKAAKAHESPPVMWVPLAILAFFSLTLGWVGIPWLGNPFHHFIGTEHHVAEPSIMIMVSSMIIALAGLGLGYWIYGRKPLAAGEPDPLLRLGGLYQGMKNKWYFDEIYGFLFVRPLFRVADGAWGIDRWGIDGVLHGISRLVYRVSEFNRLFDLYVVNGAVDLAAESFRGLGRTFRTIQTGRVQNYLLIVIINVIVLIAILIYR